MFEVLFNCAFDMFAAENANCFANVIDNPTINCTIYTKKLNVNTGDLIKTN